MRLITLILTFAIFLISCEKSPSDVCFLEEVVNDVKYQVAVETSSFIIGSVTMGTLYEGIFAQDDKNMKKIRKLLEGDMESAFQRLINIQERMSNQIYKDSNLVDKLTGEKVDKITYRCNAVFKVVIEIPKEININSDKNEKVESLFRVKYEVEYLEGSRTGTYYKVNVSDIEEIGG